MSKARESDSFEVIPKQRPATTPDAREGQLINLAAEVAEEQMRKGTASSQIIVHFLKLGSSKERIEKEILEKQKELITAKTEALKAAERVESIYKEALDAMRKYSGSGGSGDDED